MKEKPIKVIFGSPEKKLTLGNIDVECYVLEDGRRVLTQTSMINGLGMSRGGSGGTPGDRLAKFVDGKILNPYVSKELRDVTQNPLLFKTLSGSIAKGYEATTLVDICQAVLEANDDDVLQQQQKNIAKQCSIIMRSLAKVGIIALVDEVTGYQEIRDRTELQKFLDKFVTDEWSKWTKQFPDEFYKELFRVRGLAYPTPGNRPSYIGSLTNDIVYSRLAPGVLDELRKKNPKQPSGRRPRKMFQHLTYDLGIPALQVHLIKVVTLLKVVGDNQYDKFKRLLERQLPKPNVTSFIPFEEDIEN